MATKRAVRPSPAHGSRFSARFAEWYRSASTGCADAPSPNPGFAWCAAPEARGTLTNLGGHPAYNDARNGRCFDLSAATPAAEPRDWLIGLAPSTWIHGAPRGARLRGCLARRIRRVHAVVAAIAIAAAVAPSTAHGAIYWGAYVKGETYGFEDAPWDMRTLDRFEAHAGKRVSDPPLGTALVLGEPWRLSDVPTRHGRGGAPTGRRSHDHVVVVWTSTRRRSTSRTSSSGTPPTASTTPTSGSGPGTPRRGGIRSWSGSTTR